jgi:hypothetical protein
VAHLTAHAIVDAVSLLVRVVAGLRHRGTRTANPHAGANEGEEVEECRTSEDLTGIKRAGGPLVARRSGRPPRVLLYDLPGQPRLHVPQHLLHLHVVDLVV